MKRIEKITPERMKDILSQIRTVKDDRTAISLLGLTNLLFENINPLISHVEELEKKVEGLEMKQSKAHYFIETPMDFHMTKGGGAGGIEPKEECTCEEPIPFQEDCLTKKYCIICRKTIKEECTCKNPIGYKKATYTDECSRCGKPLPQDPDKLRDGIVEIMRLSYDPDKFWKLYEDADKIIHLIQ